LSKENSPICANSQAIQCHGIIQVIGAGMSLSSHGRKDQASSCPVSANPRLALFHSSGGIADIMNLPAANQRFYHADAEAMLRQQLVASLHDERVHATFEKIFGDVLPSLRNEKPAGQPFTLWRLLVHLRLCVIDFLDASRIPGYVEPPVPEGFWPDENTIADDAAWRDELAGYHAAMLEFESLLLNPSTDLFSPIPGSGGNILRQALACLDHNAYHLGQALLLRRLLGIWSD
jgi:hypothetical protein